MDIRYGRKGYREIFIGGKHLKLTELEEELRRIQETNQYISKLTMPTGSLYEIPLYPRPEFHVSHLIHDTNALFEIVQNDPGEFRTPSSWGNAGNRNLRDPDHLLWWSLSVQPEDMQSAEKRLLDRTFPDRADEQAAGQESFLQQFATSPAFLDTSRYGSFRLTFPLQELLEEYRNQVCEGLEPVLRVYETVMYRQEVLYTVLVHSDKHNDVFEEYPLLDDSPDAVCAYKDGQIIWRPEAMCAKHCFKLVDTQEKQLVAEHCDSSPQFYVWDHVVLAFHLPKAQTLNIDRNRMRCNLKFCHPGYPTVSKRETFSDFELAKKLVEERWPDHGPLSKVQE